MRATVRWRVLSRIGGFPFPASRYNAYPRARSVTAKSRLVLAALSAALAALPALAATDSARHPAEDAGPLSAPEQASVPLRDARGANPDQLHAIASKLSARSIVVIFHGANRRVFQHVQDAVREARADGYPVDSILLADGDTALTIYAGAQPYAIEDDLESDIRLYTEMMIMSAYRDRLIFRLSIEE